MSEIGQVQFVFLLLLLFVVAFGVLARKLGTPYPIVMVIGGLLLGFVPGIPSIVLNPDLIFLIILPPLLYAAAWTTSWREFRFNFISIFLLAFALVAFTVAGVAFMAPHLMLGFDWRLGLVLGAVVAPTDAIAATSIARRVGLPARIVDILEGESLLNDASGLLALQFAIALVIDKRVPTLAGGLLTFAWLTIGGIAFGLAAGLLVDFIERRIDDGPVEIALSILVPYAVYLAADEVHASGVLAVVACGLLLSRRSAKFFSPEVRLQMWSVWESLNFVLNGLVFVMIGLQLPAIRASIRGYSLSSLLIDGAIFSVFLILLRLIWVFPGSRVAWFLRVHFAHQKEPPPPLPQVFVLGWTGMRGVVSLAAALALPSLMNDGSPFPQRNVIVFLTFCVIFVTLVLQGLTLPPLVRLLGLAGTAGRDCEEEDARRIVAQAALAHLEAAKSSDSDQFAAVYEDLMLHYQHRLSAMEPGGDRERAAHHERHAQLVQEATRIERETAIRLRREGRINDEVLRRLERELDLIDSRSK